MKKNILFTVLCSFMLVISFSAKVGCETKTTAIKNAYALDPWDDCDQQGGLINIGRYDNGLLAYEHFRYYCEGGDGWCPAGDLFFAYIYDEITLQLIDVIVEDFIVYTVCDIE